MAKLASVGGSQAEEFELYPENVLAARLFQRVRRCWRVVGGMGSAKYLGLDWDQVRSKLELSNTPREQWPALLDDLEVMEEPALDEISRMQQARQPPRR